MKHTNHADLERLELITIRLEKVPKEQQNNAIISDMKWLCDKLREAHTYIEREKE